MPEHIEPAAYEQRIERISELFTSMMGTATELSTRRCPYKNRFDECTAQFGCRNQQEPREPQGLKVCGGDDKLDYRGAWETA